jgi:hypothetical protein
VSYEIQGEEQGNGNSRGIIKKLIQFSGIMEYLRSYESCKG